MARAYLNDGATSLAAANWSDATGFATNADLVINGSTSGIVSGLDQSAVVTGIDSLIIARTFSGNIRTASAALKVDIDGVTGQWTSAAPTKAKLVDAASGGVHAFEAGGASGVIENTFIDAPNTTVLCSGGTWTYFNVINGTVNVGATAALVTANVDGGVVTIEYKAAGLTTLNILAGDVTLKRPASTAINLYGGRLILDDDAATATVAVNQFGGTFDHVAGNITTHNANAGAYTSSRMRKTATIATRNRRQGFKFTDNSTFQVITTDIRLWPTDSR